MSLLYESLRLLEDFSWQLLYFDTILRPFQGYVRMFKIEFDLIQILNLLEGR
jgi:hypothetical protein